MAKQLQWVGNIVDVDGPRVEVSRIPVNGTQSGWFRAMSGQRLYLGDCIRTCRKTTVILEFLIGGKAGGAPGSIIKLVSPTDIGYVTVVEAWTWSAEKAHAAPWGRPKYPTKFGWDVFDKNKRPEQIQTSGGVIGIEG